MKLRNLIPVAAIAFLVSCGPTTYEVADGTVVVVPENTRTTFTTQYPTAAEIAWSHYDPNLLQFIDRDLVVEWPIMDAEDYVVSFNMDGVPYYAWYDDEGTWVGTTYAISNFNTIPVVVNTTVTQQYPGYTMSTARKVYWKDRMAYEVELKNGDTKVKMLVDENGNILKQKTKTM